MHQSDGERMYRGSRQRQLVHAGVVGRASATLPLACMARPDTVRALLRHDPVQPPHPIPAHYQICILRMTSGANCTY